MISASKLLDLLPFFNKTGSVFRGVVIDRDRAEFEQIQNINDLNRGAIHNAVEWHLRTRSRAIDEAVLTNATGIFLDEHEKLYGTDRPAGMTDEEYAAFIISRVTSTSNSTPTIAGIFAEAGENGPLLYPDELGAYSDACFADVGPLRDDRDRASSVVTFERNSLYLILVNPPLSAAAIIKIKGTRAAGSAIFIGVE